ncbi:MAG TPA: AMP-binding protein [Steroidobacter sp.]|uniref:AMP-binding protein n=1 Tax=Steroidobacter sp. TaxID=1978227 RepID=UPI002ED95D5D
MIVPLTINDFVDRAAAVYPDRVAIVDEPNQPAPPLPDLTWRQIADLRRQMGVAMDKMGLPAGARIAVVSPNAARFLLLYYGVCCNGRVLVPINFRLKREEVAWIVAHSHSDVLLLDPDVADELGDIECPRVITMGPEFDAAWFGHAGEPSAHEPAETDIVSIDYTSGTTSKPKGVEQTQRARWTDSVVMGWHLGVSERDVYLSVVPIFHCDGWSMPYTLAALGVKTIVLRKVDGMEILRRVRDHGVTLMCCAPAVCASILDAAAKWDRASEGDIPGRGRTRIVVAGAPPPTSIIERVETELGWEFIQIYGLTETAPLLTVNRCRPEWDSLSPPERAKKLGRAGVPVVGIRMKIDEEGELLARGNHVLTNYWKEPQVTAEALRGGWFHTGDGGYVDDEGYFNVTDRKKDVIITGAENVSSIEVEDRLLSHPQVKEAAVIGVPSEKWGETVKALVVLAEGSSLTESDLIAFCRDKLAHYKCPTSVEFRAALERTATGKLQKFKLREPYWAGRERKV